MSPVRQLATLVSLLCLLNPFTVTALHLQHRSLHQHAIDHSHHTSHLTGSRDPQTTYYNASLASDSFENILARGLLPRADSGQSSSSASSGDYTCGPNKPCSNGACCGKSGWCGYSPTYCGAGCQSNCNAKAECGQYAKDPGQSCPLNVCCSQHGFCGTTAEFCGTGCQSNCQQPKPNAPRTNVQQKVIGYWQAWNENKACEHMSASEIPVHDLSHLIYSFAFVTPNDFKIVNMADVRKETFREIAYLKNKNPDLQIQVALGGWTHNDPGKWQKVFTTMVSSKANRTKFIKNLLGFLSQYGFDGVDFDWEYPGAPDRGGSPSDGVNYTQLLKELKAAIRSAGKDYIVTFTAPTSYWYLRWFDIAGMNQYVNWINLMSYDLHGVWDSDNPIGNQVLAHTNITEIDMALDLFWRSKIPPANIVLGVGFYGRSFRLKDKKCYKPGCKFEATNGGGEVGKCTDTSGFLSYSEIMDIVRSRNIKPFYDKQAQVKYITYGRNSWISYDDAETFEKKIEFANNKGLGGLMIWAIDLDDSRRTALSALTGRTVESPLALGMSRKTSVGHSTDDASKCRVTECGEFCTVSETAVGRARTYFGYHACPGDSANARYVCCPAWTSLDADDCYYNAGGGAVRTDCSGKCNAGDIQMFGDGWGWSGGLGSGNYEYQCLRGYKAFCCAAGNKKRLLDICTWTQCGEACPSDKQNVLTTDSGGPLPNSRCNYQSSGSPFDQFGPGQGADDPKKGTVHSRKLCCPKKDSFKNCGWKSGGYCSEFCTDGQVTLGLDPQGPGSNTCHNGRQQVFCCDVPGKADTPFLPVDLDRIFPPEHLPPPDAKPQFELSSFNGVADIGAADPNLSGVAFFLIAGSDTAVSSMRKRGANGIVFLDCPANILDVPHEQVQTARVICMNDDPEECFKVRLNGVEGTVVHMPQECGQGSFSRAISLFPSQNQSVPIEMAQQNPTSAVYDFTFDYNMPLVRRDAGKLSIRMDYSNVRGYWDAVVDSPGNKKRDLEQLVERFYSSSRSDWANKFNSLDISRSKELDDLHRPLIKNLIYFDAEKCNNGDRTAQGVAANIFGQLDATFHYGFSLIATWEPSSPVKIHQAAGFLHVEGSTRASYTVAGIGVLDTAQALGGSAIRKRLGKRTINGHALYHGWASFESYKEESVSLKTSSDGGSAVVFNGYLEAKVEADWGNNVNIHFPSTPTGLTAKDIKVSRNSKMTPHAPNGPTNGKIAISGSTKLGLRPVMYFSKPYQFAVAGKLPDMSVEQTVAAEFSFNGDDKGVCLDTHIYHDIDAVLEDGDYAGWGSSYTRQYIYQAHKPAVEQCWSKGQRRDMTADEVFSEASADDFTPDKDHDASNSTSEGTASSRRKTKRQNSSFTFGDYSGVNSIGNARQLIPDIPAPTGSNLISLIQCVGCARCSVDVKLPPPCCACSWLPSPDPPDGTWKNMQPLKRSLEALTLGNGTNHSATLHELHERATVGGVREGEKDLIFWYVPWQAGRLEMATALYPNYPSFAFNPVNPVDFDAVPKYAAVKRYFHNATDSCFSFDVVQSGRWDVMYPYPKLGRNGYVYQRGVAYHQDYQTEHVFEGQSIVRFVDYWLSGRAVPTRSRSWVNEYMLRARGNAPWNSGRSDPIPFIHKLIDELGQLEHLDRLTVLLARPNRLKGNLFGGGNAITMPTFRTYDKGEQTLAARELGMVFPYLNMDTVWDSFCSSYNGMLAQLQDFDTYMQRETNENPRLVDEFPRFVRAELDNIVRTARRNLKEMYDESGFDFVYGPIWLRIMHATYGEIQKVKLDRRDKCVNLPATTVRPYTGSGLTLED